VENVELNEEQIEEFLPEILKKLDWLSREDLIKHFVSVEFNRFSSYYKNAPDLNIDAEKSPHAKGKKKQDTKKAGHQGEFTRFFVNLGKINKLSTAKLIGLVNDATHTRDIEIGKIDILRKFSFFEIIAEHEELVLQSFAQGVKYDGIRVSVEVSKPEGEKSKGGFNKNDRPYKKFERSRKKPGGKQRKYKGGKKR
jgi:ATP-dependent RNA helicase DeaD